VASIGVKRKVYKVVFVGKPEGRRPLGRPRRRWEGGSERILGRLTGRCGVDSIGSG
jgi:hypothetical protein